MKLGYAGAGGGCQGQGPRRLALTSAAAAIDRQLLFAAGIERCWQHSRTLVTVRRQAHVSIVRATFVSTEVGGLMVVSIVREVAVHRRTAVWWVLQLKLAVNSPACIASS